MNEELKIVSRNDAAAAAIVAPVGPFGAAPAKDSSKKKEDSDFPFAVAVSDVYEGPLDLLLDLIRKQDIDIYDIPIASITAQYLEYMQKAMAMDIELSSEFVYMAATLIHIK